MDLLKIRVSKGRQKQSLKKLEISDRDRSAPAVIWGLLWCAETFNFSLHFYPLHPAPAPEKISPKLIQELDINSLPLFLLIHESTFAYYFYDLFIRKGVEYFLKVKI